MFKEIKSAKKLRNNFWELDRKEGACTVYFPSESALNQKKIFSTHQHTFHKVMNIIIIKICS